MIPTLDEQLHYIVECTKRFSPTNYNASLKLIQENETRLRASPGSRSVDSHQWWPGGFLDHIADMMRYAAVEYAATNALYENPFALADVNLAILLHDIEKPWKYVEPVVRFDSKDARQQFREQVIVQYGFDISDEVVNGIRYAEGEGDYEPGKRKMLSLATLVHASDIYSARRHPDKPGPR